VAAHRPIEFAHPVLFDYATAIIALGDIRVPDSVADRLDADPDLAMVRRPGLDYRLAIVWHDDRSRTDYWRLCLRLAAAATVAAHELRDAVEVKLLESACVAAPADATWDLDDARGLANRLTDASGAWTSVARAAKSCPGAAGSGDKQAKAKLCRIEIDEVAVAFCPPT
jgi:hypothetical protein